MWPQVDLRQERAFLVLTKELHFGRTAARLGVTRARVSQTIRALEARVGVPLFDRTSRRVTLTPLGAELEGRLRPAHSALAAALERPRQVSAARRGRYESESRRSPTRSPFMTWSMRSRASISTVG